MPPEVGLPLQMQAMELKPTDLWAYLMLPHGFVDRWTLTANVIAEYRKEMMETGE